jgi:hypothetical protein
MYMRLDGTLVKICGGGSRSVDLVVIPGRAHAVAMREGKGIQVPHPTRRRNLPPGSPFLTLAWLALAGDDMRELKRSMPGDAWQDCACRCKVLAAGTPIRLPLIHTRQTGAIMAGQPMECPRMSQPPALPAAEALPDAVEDELNAMIGEARQIIRDFIVPSGKQCTDRYDRIAFLDEAMHLMTAAAKIGDTIARLRGGAAPETRHRLVVEHRGGSPAEK